MRQEPATRFDDLLLDAVAAIQAMTRRGKPWEDAPELERGRALELDRGVAGERRYARKAENQKLALAIDALEGSASAQLRMLEALTTEGDEKLAKKLNRDAERYAAAARPQAKAKAPSKANAKAPPKTKARPKANAATKAR